MRINTDGNKEYREDLYESAMGVFDENTKVGAIDTACEHAQMDLKAKKRALEHPDMTEELAELLSTPMMQLHYEVETDITSK